MWNNSTKFAIALFIIGFSIVGGTALYSLDKWWQIIGLALVMVGILLSKQTIISSSTKGNFYYYGLLIVFTLLVYMILY